MNLKNNKAFTLIEMLMVIVILAIISLMVIPQMSSASSAQLDAASSIIASDLEYAKSLSISKQQWHSVVFDESGESYQIQDSDGNVVPYKMNPSGYYIVNFTKDSRLSRIDLHEAKFDDSSIITFDYLGSPYSGSGTSNPMASGSITLQVQGIESHITIEPVTGYIRIN